MRKKSVPPVFNGGTFRLFMSCSAAHKNHGNKAAHSGYSYTAHLRVSVEFSVRHVRRTFLENRIPAYRQLWSSKGETILEWLLLDYPTTRRNK
jgi:hypothetical protein